jgi:hypothetical protein
MSYEIYYGNCFIKIDEERFIPIIVSGSNNCFECGVGKRIGRRERNFSVITGWDKQRNYIATEKDIENLMKSWKESEIERNLDYTKRGIGSCTDDTMDSFRHKGRGMRVTSFERILKRAIKKAKTVEEIFQKFTIRVGVWDYKEGWIKKHYPNTTEELLSAIEDCKPLTEEGHYVSIDFDVVNVDRVLKFFKTKVKPRRRARQMDEYFIIKNVEENHFYSGHGRYCTKWTEARCFAKAYVSERSAQLRVKSLCEIKPRKLIVEKISK